jgi:predicted esterase
MKKTLTVYSLVLLFLGFLSCISGHSPKQADQRQNPAFETGKVISEVSCLKDSSTKYALYLPENYSSSRTFPVILAFDPHGSGNLPLELYHELAEKYGYIFIGSNDSKNGVSISETNRIITSLFEEINSRFSIDTNRIYAMGFSGGARIASLIGLFRGGVSCVIGCGAGFPGINQPGKFQFDYIGFAGTYDFNMNELVRLDEQMVQLEFNHALFLFDGIHEWPSKSLMEKAFLWTECCAMRKNQTPKNEKLILSQKQLFDSLLVKDKGTTDKISYHRDLKNAISFMKDLTETVAYKRALYELENDPVYIRQSKDFQRQLEKESQEQQALQDDFFFKDIAWWKERIRNYDQRIKNEKNPADARMCRRMKSYLSLVSYLNYNRMLNSNDKEKAAFSLQVYQIVDPENAAKIK